MERAQVDIRGIRGQFAGLECHIRDVPANRPPRILVAMCHGSGATGLEMASMAADIFSRLPDMTQDVRFIFPEGPVYPDGPFGEARAWWRQSPADMAKSLEAPLETSQRTPEGLPRVREQLCALLEQSTRELGIPMSQVVLGGFDQGAVLATDVALRLPVAPAALCILSSSVMLEDWSGMAEQRKGLRVLQCHGLLDEQAPFDQAIRLGEMLDGAGLQVEFFPFSDAHLVPHTVHERLGRLLTRCLEPSRTPDRDAIGGQVGAAPVAKELEHPRREADGEGKWTGDRNRPAPPFLAGPRRVAPEAGDVMDRALAAFAPRAPIKYCSSRLTKCPVRCEQVFDDSIATEVKDVFVDAAISGSGPLSIAYVGQAVFDPHPLAQ